MKIVVDSNIIVAAYASRGLCSSLFEMCLDRFDIIISEYIISEVTSALSKKIKLPESSVNKISSYLKEFCIVSIYKKLDEPICRDVNDNDIIALAENNNVEYIITGDDDLLVLKKYKNIQIKSPREFWEIVRKWKN